MRFYRFAALALLFVYFGATVSAGQPSPAGAPFLTIPMRGGKSYNPKICHVCGESRSECNRKARKYRKNPASISKDKLCKIHTSYGRIKVTLTNCPVCGYQVGIPVKPMRSTDTDADLCPHPVGMIKFRTDIPICPRCGFAAYRQRFRQPQPAWVRRWVSRTLTRSIRQAEWQLLTRALKVGPARDNLFLPDGRGGKKAVPVASLFTQESLPDTIRCEHALAFYLKLPAAGAKQKKLALQVRARLTWECAWAYRRELTGPIAGPYIMSSMMKIMRAVENTNDGEADLQDRINLLARLFNQKKSNGAFRFNYMDRQVIRLVLAGYYDRLGCTRWAQACLQQALRNAESRPAGGNPWLEGARGSATAAAAETETKREAIRVAAMVRVQLLNQEMRYLGQAVARIREALANDVYAAEGIPSLIYLVGEFERRLENFATARVWLATAKKLRGRKVRIEHFAPLQLELMADYVQRLGLDPAAGKPTSAADLELLSSLTSRVRARRALAARPPFADNPKLSLKPRER